MTFQETLSINQEQAPLWTRESYYFGNAMDPSWAEYRRSGDCVQYRVEVEIEVSEGSGTSAADVVLDEQLMALLNQLDEPRLRVYPIDTQNARLGIPQWAYLSGWRDLTTDDDWEQYVCDKRDGALTETPYLQ